MFANFCGVNAPTIYSFTLPRRQVAHKLPENLTEDPQEQI